MFSASPIGFRLLRQAAAVALAAWGGGELAPRAALAGGGGVETAQAVAPEGSDRAEWLRRAITERDRVFLDRSPQLVAQKYSKMARNQFTFFRATAWLPARSPSAFTTAASSKVAVMGDPHPENVGVAVGKDGLRALEFNDFDLAGYGSYLDDLRRLALSFWIVGDRADLKHKERARMAEAVVDGYLAEIRDLSKGAPAANVDASEIFGGRLDAILASRSEPEDQPRADPASPEEVALARAVLLESLPAALSGSSNDGGRRTGSGTAAGSRALNVFHRNAGITSFPVLRLQVVLSDPRIIGDGGVVLEIKESQPGSARLGIAIEREYNRTPADSPLPAWTAVDGREFRLHGLALQHRLSVERIVKEVDAGRAGKAELEQLAFQVGRLLARGHCTAKDRDGAAGLSAIKAAITSEAGLKADTVGYAERAAETNKSDYRLFRQLLLDSGPLLGRQTAAAHK